MKRTLSPMAATTLLVLGLSILPAAAQSGVKTRLTRDASGQATIVIHDSRPASATRQQDTAERAFQAREADLQRKHELQLAQIEADTQVRIAALRSQATQQQTAAPPVTVAKREEPRPSYRNGGQFTGFSPVFFGGFAPYGYFGGGYGYGGGGFNCAPAAPRCAPAPRFCR